jgi:hypothetical protein
MDGDDDRIRRWQTLNVVVLMGEELMVFLFAPLREEQV